MVQKWINVQVSQKVLDDMKERYEETPPKEKKEKGKYASLPYLEVVITGEAPEKKYENFDRVMFPALCLYGWGKQKQLGCINCAFINQEIVYELHDMSQQHGDINREYGYASLVKMNECHNIEIVKAKIIAKRG